MEERREKIENGPLKWRAVCFLEEFWEGCDDVENYSVVVRARFDGWGLRAVDAGGSSDDFV
jgi:hypothetical protein